MGRRFDLVAYLKLFRFPLVFTAIADSAAGYLLVQRAPDARVLGLLALASACLYCFGMGMNDIADRERDKAIAPNRMLPSGRISLLAALCVCHVLGFVSAASVLLVTQGHPLRLAVWGGVLLAILAYDFFLKVPPVMGLVRAGNFLLGVSCANPGAEPGGNAARVAADYLPFFLAALAPLLYGTSLTLVSTLEEGQVRKRVVLLGSLFMAVAAALPVLLQSPWYFHRAAWGFLPAGVLAAWTLFRAYRAIDRRGIMLLVRDGVAGFILLDSTQLAAAGKLVPAAAVAALLVPAALSVAWFKKLA